MNSHVNLDCNLEQEGIAAPKIVFFADPRSVVLVRVQALCPVRAVCTLHYACLSLGPRSLFISQPGVMG